MFYFNADFFSSLTIYGNGKPKINFQKQKKSFLDFNIFSFKSSGPPLIADPWSTVDFYPVSQCR